MHANMLYMQDLGPTYVVQKQKKTRDKKFAGKKIASGETVKIFSRWKLLATQSKCTVEPLYKDTPEMRTSPLIRTL